MRRALLFALSCGLAALVVVLIWRGRTSPPVRRAPAVQAPASAAVPVVPPAPIASPVAAPAASRAASVAVKPTPPPARAKFALSSDHQALIRQSLLATPDHELLEREPRDDPWASDAERLIRQELANHDSASNFDIVAVDCRQTLCAIQAFSYGEDSHRIWGNTIDDLYKKSLIDSFDSVNVAVPTHGGRAPVLAFLHRKPTELKPEGR